MVALRVAAVVALLTAIVDAQTSAPPDALRALREMEVVGAAVFDRDQIATALLGDAETMRVLGRGLDDEAITMVAECVRELHRRGGYAEAEARGELVDGIVRVSLTAGTRYRRGEVVCTGNTHLPTATLRTRLAERVPPSMFASEIERLAVRSSSARAWVPGEFPVMDDQAAERLAKAVVDAYRAIGRYGAKATVSFEPDGDRIRLAVRIADEGHEVRIRDLRIDGDEAEGAAAIAALAFTPDSLATTAAVGGWQRALEATGRYQEVVCEVPEDAPASVDALVFRVTLRPGALPIDVDRRRAAVQLERMIEHALARLQSGDMVRVRCTLAEPKPLGLGWRILPGAVVAHIGSAGAEVSVQRVETEGRAPDTVAFGFAKERLWLRVGEHAANLAAGSPLGIRLEARTRMGTDGNFEVRWGVGWHTSGSDLLDVALHPATAAHVLSRASEVRRDGEALVVRFGSVEVRVDANGELADAIRFEVDGNAFEVALAGADSLDSARHGGESADVAALARDVATAMLSAGAAAESHERPLVLGFVEAAAIAVARWVSRSVAAHDEDASSVPSLGGKGPTSLPLMIGLGVATLAVQREVDGHLADWSGAFGAALLGDDRSAAARFDAIANSDRHGPLSLGLIASIWHLLGNDRAANAFRRLANERCTLAAALADADAVFASMPALRAVPEQVGARWRAQPELQERFVGMPAGRDGDLAAWRTGLEMLWRDGGEALLRELLLGEQAVKKPASGR